MAGNRIERSAQQNLTPRIGTELLDIDAEWDLRDVGWRIQLAGDSPLDIAITNPVARERLAEVAPNKTPFRVVNAVPWVCAAPCGIRMTADLPQIVPYLGKW